MKPKKILATVLITLTILICSGVTLFLGMLYKDLNFYPFDKISLTENTLFAVGHYYKDRSGNLYFGFNQGTMVYEPLNVDKASFQVVNGNYAKDKNHAYDGDTIIEGADLATFTAIPRAANFYIHGLATRDPQINIMQGHLYIPMNDANKFNDTHENDQFAMDKNYIYSQGIRLTENKYKKVVAVGPDMLIADSDILFGHQVSLINKISFPQDIDIAQFQPYSKEFWKVNHKIYCLSNNTPSYLELKDVNKDKFEYYENKNADSTGEPIIFGDGKVFYQNNYAGECQKTTL